MWQNHVIVQQPGSTFSYNENLLSSQWLVLIFPSSLETKLLVLNWQSFEKHFIRSILDWNISCRMGILQHNMSVANSGIDFSLNYAYETMNLLSQIMLTLGSQLRTKPSEDLWIFQQNNKLMVPRTNVDYIRKWSSLMLQLVYLPFLLLYFFPWNISHTKFVFFNIMIVAEEEVPPLKKNTSIFGANTL